MKALPMFSGSGACSSLPCRFNHSLTIRCERSAMSAMERPSSSGAGSLNPGGSVLVLSAMRVLSVGTATRYLRHQPGADSAMLFSRIRGQPTGVKGRVQVGYTLAPLAVLLFSGCSSLPGSMNPVNWWHDLEGGKIAEERPPPPGADE